MYHWHDFENIKRGTYHFPIEFYHVTKAHPRYVMPYHWHQEIEIIRVLEGSLTIYIDEKKYILQKDEYLYVSQNAIHGGFPENCVYQCIVCDFLAILQNNASFSCYSDLFTNRKITPFYNKNDTETLHVLEKLFDTMKNRAEGWQITTIGCLFQFLGTVLEKHYFEDNPEDKRAETPNITRFRNVFKLIRSKYAEALTLETMAAEAHMSPNYFSQIFKEITHYSPIEYLLHYRIEYSKYLLCVKDLSVSEAAIHSGFNNCAYYIKVFKKNTGITPNKYKKLHLPYKNL